MRTVDGYQQVSGPVATGGVGGLDSIQSRLKSASRVAGKRRRSVMLKRLKVWTYLAVLLGGSLLGGGCGYGLDLDNVTRVIVAILNEDLFG